MTPHLPMARDGREPFPAGTDGDAPIGALLDLTGDQLDYVYDFGDNRGHTLTVEKIAAPEPGVRYPRCVAGRRSCPPEDVGGPWGYGGFLEAMADPAHPEHDEHAEWARGSFDPARFDLDEVNKAMQGLAWRSLTASSASSTGLGRP